jgi:hypothetical protein
MLFLGFAYILLDVCRLLASFRMLAVNGIDHLSKNDSAIRPQSTSANRRAVVMSRRKTGRSRSESGST